MAAHLHNQSPATTLTEGEYDTLLVHLGEQLTARCLAEGFPEDQAADAASNALTNEWHATENQTILEWLTAAGRRLGVSTDSCIGA